MTHFGPSGGGGGGSSIASINTNALFPPIADAAAGTNIYNLWHPLVGSASASATVANTLFLTPAVMPETSTVDEMGLYITAGTASSTFRMGLYNRGDDGLPTTLVLDSGEIDSATSSTLEVNTGLSTEVDEGGYWIGYLFSAAISCQGMVAANSITMMTTETLGSGAVPGTGFLQKSQAYGAMPADLTSETFAFNPFALAGRSPLGRWRG